MYADGLLEKLNEALQDAQFGQVLLRDVRLSAFEAISESTEEHGLSFSATETLDDPLGIISLAKDPTKPHETAARELMYMLRKSLDGLGLEHLFQESGSATTPFGSGNRMPGSITSVSWNSFRYSIPETITFLTDFRNCMGKFLVSCIPHQLLCRKLAHLWLSSKLQGRSLLQASTPTS